MYVFFYGLFMDRRLLEKQGLNPGSMRKAHLPDYRLSIGQRAAVTEDEGAKCYGMLADLAPDEVLKLYSTPGVSDYQPISVSVALADGSVEVAICYNLPADKNPLGSNIEYAKDLHRVASALHFPDHYLNEILFAIDATMPLDSY